MEDFKRGIEGFKLRIEGFKWAAEDFKRDRKSKRDEIFKLGNHMEKMMPRLY